MKNEFLEFRKNALQGGGITTPLCADYRRMWSACHDDKEKLMKLALMCQSAPYLATFFNKGKCVSKEYVKREFSDFINGRVLRDCDGVDGFTYGMFFDAPTGFKINIDVCQILYCNNTDVEIEKTKCPRLYVSNDSNINISLDGYNSITIYLFDDSVINIDSCDDTCNVKVYRYSKDAKVNIGKFCLGEVKVFDKELRI